MQWLGLHASNAGGPGSIPDRGAGSRMHAAARSSNAATEELASLN